MVQARVSLQTKIRKVTSSKEFHKNLFVFLVLLLPTIGFLIFWFYVHLDSFVLSFRKDPSITLFDDPQGVLEDFTLDNYVKIFREFFDKNGSLGRATLNTLIYFFSGLLISLPLSILFSYFIYKKIRGYKFFRVITYLPTIITSSVLIALFIQMFSIGGPFHYIKLQQSGGSVVGYKPFFLQNSHIAMFTLVFYSISFSFGGNIVVLCGAMNSIDKQILEAGELDGCNWVRELFSIILPTIWPTISTMILLSFTGMFGASGPLLAFYPTLNNQINVDAVTTLNFEMYRYVVGNLGRAQDLCFASTIGMVLSLMTIPIVFIVKKFTMDRE